NGVAVHSDDVYVLEYTNANGGQDQGWQPRVRKIGRDGKVTVLATIEAGERDRRPREPPRDGLKEKRPTEGAPVRRAGAGNRQAPAELGHRGARRVVARCPHARRPAHLPPPP